MDLDAGRGGPLEMSGRSEGHQSPRRRAPGKASQQLLVAVRSFGDLHPGAPCPRYPMWLKAKVPVARADWCSDLLSAEPLGQRDGRCCEADPLAGP